MKLIKVDSSNIAKAGYDIEKKILRLQFESGKVYNYSAVPPNVVLEFLFAESLGKYFNTNIKDKYTVKAEEN